MSIETDSLLRIFPYRKNEFNPRAPILDAGPAPGLTGIDAIVLNQATLWAQSGHIIISEKMRREEDVADWGSGFPVYYGSWSFQIPKWTNASSGVWRRFMTFMVDTDLGASPTVTMTATSSAGSATGVRTSYNGRWVTMFEVPIPFGGVLPNDAVTETVVLSAQWSGVGSATFTVFGVYGWVRRVSGTLTTNATSSGVIDFVDNTQLTYQQPIDVHSMRALNATNEVLFASNMRPVVTMGWWPGGTDEAADSTPLTWPIELSDDLTDSEVNPFWEWAYYPRQGVRRLRIWLSAVKAGVDDRELFITFKGHDIQQTVTVSATASSNDPTYWQETGGLYLDVPSDKGPFFLQIGLVVDSTTNDAVRLMKVMVHEEILKGNNLTT